jgi:hypothetical protein
MEAPYHLRVVRGGPVEVPFLASARTWSWLRGGGRVGAVDRGGDAGAADGAPSGGGAQRVAGGDASDGGFRTDVDAVEVAGRESYLGVGGDAEAEGGPKAVVRRVGPVPGVVVRKMWLTVETKSTRSTVMEPEESP